MAALALAVVLLRVQLPDPPPPPSPLRSLQVYDVDMAASDRVFALVGDCVTGACGVRLAVTEDGQRWTRARTPLGPITSPSEMLGGVVTALGGGVLIADGTSVDRSWFSGDDGRNWMPVSSFPVGETNQIPEGAVLSTSRYPPSEPMRAVILLPDSGERRTLAGTPALRIRGGMPVPVAGAWWLTGAAPGTGAPVVAGSRDGGLSWTVAELPGADPDSVIRVSGTRTVLYATVSSFGTPPDWEDRRSDLYRSVDGGRTWALAHRGDPGSDAGEVAAVGPQGQILVRDPASVTMLRSSDGGRAFTPVTEPPFLEYVELTAGGYLGRRLNGTYLTSTDGVDWRELRLPPGS